MHYVIEMLSCDQFVGRALGVAEQSEGRKITRASHVHTMSSETEAETSIVQISNHMIHLYQKSQTTPTA